MMFLLIVIFLFWKAWINLLTIDMNKSTQNEYFSKCKVQVIKLTIKFAEIDSKHSTLTRIAAASCLILWLTLAILTRSESFTVVERFAAAVNTRNLHKYTVVCLLVTKEGIQGMLKSSNSSCLNELYVQSIIS